MRFIVPGFIVIFAALQYFGQLWPTGKLSLEVQDWLNLCVMISGLWLLQEALRHAKKDRFQAADFKQAVSTLAEVQKQNATLEAKAREIPQLQNELASCKEALSEAIAASQLQLSSARHDEAVNLLSLLQGKGRFLDFVMDDISRYRDEQIGAAARVVHQGCSALIREYFEIKPVHDGFEGSNLTLEKGYDHQRYRILGRVVGEPPYQGRILHRGWLTTAVKLPERVLGTLSTPNVSDVITPAEVEIS